MENELDQPADELEKAETPPEEREVRSRPLFRVIGIILIALAVVLGVYGTVAYLAWQESQDVKAENARAVLLEEIDSAKRLADVSVLAAQIRTANTSGNTMTLRRVRYRHKASAGFRHCLVLLDKI